MLIDQGPFLFAEPSRIEPWGSQRRFVYDLTTPVQWVGLRWTLGGSPTTLGSLDAALEASPLRGSGTLPVVEDGFLLFATHRPIVHDVRVGVGVFAENPDVRVELVLADLDVDTVAWAEAHRGFQIGAAQGPLAEIVPLSVLDGALYGPQIPWQVYDWVGVACSRPAAHCAARRLLRRYPNWSTKGRASSGAALPVGWDTVVLEELPEDEFAVDTGGIALLPPVEIRGPTSPVLRVNDDSPPAGIDRITRILPHRVNEAGFAPQAMTWYLLSRPRHDDTFLLPR